jgi:hypothetical protein
MGNRMSGMVKERISGGPGPKDGNDSKSDGKQG